MTQDLGPPWVIVSLTRTAFNRRNRAADVTCSARGQNNTYTIWTARIQFEPLWTEAIVWSLINTFSSVSQPEWSQWCVLDRRIASAGVQFVLVAKRTDKAGSYEFIKFFAGFRFLTRFQVTDKFVAKQWKSIWKGKNLQAWFITLQNGLADEYNTHRFRRNNHLVR